ncbi:MAG: BtpA/SgcQ family protein [Candidatus Krumholzibacteriia bacterium]
MIHLEPLPGAPAYGGSLATVIEAACGDLQALQEGGIEAVMVENFHDVPFHPERVPAATVAALAVVAAELKRQAPGLALGINVLRNDAEAALAVAAAVGAQFIRINVHVGAMVTDQGPLVGQAHRTLRRRRELGLEAVGILADIRVKHAAPLAPRGLADEARDLRLRGLADGLIVSGAATGAAADPADLVVLRDALPDCPLLVGSGVTLENLPAYVDLADAVIVGTSLKAAGRVDPTRVRALVAALSRGKDPS